jgi:hypothetical protein
MGHGGIACVERAVAISRSTISRGIKELAVAQKPLEAVHIRRPGGGRKRTAQHDPTLRTDLEALVEPAGAGDPQSPLRWTSKSLGARRRAGPADAKEGGVQIGALRGAHSCSERPPDPSLLVTRHRPCLTRACGGRSRSPPETLGSRRMDDRAPQGKRLANVPNVRSPVS